jgi:hypothetical protein
MREVKLTSRFMSVLIMSLNRKKYCYIVKSQTCIGEITGQERKIFSLIIPLR